jgi:SSS family solute:Na+ symporter
LVSGLWEAHTSGTTLLGATKEAGGQPQALTMAHPFNPFLSKGTGWVLWQALTALAVMTTWQTTISRVLAAKDAATAKRVYRGTWFYFAGRWALPGLWGAAAFLYFTRHGGLPPGANSETALPEFLAILLKPGLLGIVLAAMLAAEMSTDSGYLLTWATVIYNDLINPCLRRPMSERARLLTVRLLVLAIGLFLVVYGLWYQMPGNVWAYLAITGNIYLASMFALLVGALYWRGANTWGALSAIALGAAGPISYLVANAIAGKEVVPDWVAGLCAFGLAFAGMFVGSLVGQTVGQTSAAAAVEVEETLL